MLDVATLDDVREPLVAEAPAQDAAPIRWRLATRVAFRLCVSYFGLYVIATQMLNSLVILPFDVGVPNLGSLQLSTSALSWVAKHVLRVHYEFLTTQTGSGDKTVDWVQAFCLLLIAARRHRDLVGRRSPPPELSLALQQVVPSVPALLARLDDDRLRHGEGDSAADAGARACSACSSRSATSRRWACSGIRSARRRAYEMFAGCDGAHRRRAALRSAAGHARRAGRVRRLRCRSSR